MARTKDTIMVIGIGRFGLSVARNLVHLGTEVVALDESESRIQKFADELTMAVQADSTDMEALNQLGVNNYHTVVIGMGSDIEASIITAMNLVNAGVPDIWAKAINTRHGEILNKIGVHHVVFPERAMGERVAHVIADELVDYLDFEDGTVLASVRAPKRCWNMTVEAIDTKFGVTTVGVNPDQAPLRAAKADEVITATDTLLVSGLKRTVERFCDQR